MPTWRLPTAFWKLVQFCSSVLLKHRHFVKLLLRLFLRLALLPHSLSFRCSTLETSTTVHTATRRVRTYMFTAGFRTILLFREKQQHTINTPYAVLGLHIFYVTKTPEYRSLCTQTYRGIRANTILQPTMKVIVTSRSLDIISFKSFSSPFQQTWHTNSCHTRTHIKVWHC